MKYLEPAGLKESYEFDCAACDHNQRASPSIMMLSFGINTGGGRCLKCGTFLHLEIAPDNSKMVSQRHDEYVEELKRQINEGDPTG